MFRWLTRYVKEITIYVNGIGGVTVVIREDIPPDEAKELIAGTQPTATTLKSKAPAQSESVVRQERCIRIAGASPSSRRAARELDLMLDGEQIELHIHQPGGTQGRFWVGREDLQASLQPCNLALEKEQATVPGRTARSRTEVVFVGKAGGEIEVQAGWWIWVPREDFKGALEALGIRVPW